MPQNHRMLEVFRESGFPVEVSSKPGAIRVELPTSFARARLAVSRTATGLRPCRASLLPRARGGDRDRGIPQSRTVGGQLFHNLLESGFEGVVYPVNPSADVVQAVHAYRTVADLPEDVELAVIAVPAAGVIDVARKCGEPGVRAAGRDLGRIRRGGSGGNRTGAGAGRGLPCRGHPTGRPELPRHPEHGCRPTSTPPSHRTPRPPATSGSSARAALWARADRPGRDRGLGSPRSPRSATAPTSPRTTSSSTGRVTARPGWPCSTSSLSATRGGFRGSPGPWVAESRSWW